MKFLLVALLLALPTFASAQGAPYSPKAADWSSLLKPASYVESPLRLSYPEVERRRVVNGARMDFEHVYDVEYTELVQAFELAYKDRTPIMAFRPGAIPYANVTEALIVGIPTRGTARYTIGALSLPLRFTIELRPEQNRTVVTFQNSLSTQLYSGVMPVRVGYKPQDSKKQIPFRWN